MKHITSLIAGLLMTTPVATAYGTLYHYWKDPQIQAWYHETLDTVHDTVEETKDIIDLSNLSELIDDYTQAAEEIIERGE